MGSLSSHERTMAVADSLQGNGHLVLHTPVEDGTAQARLAETVAD